MPAPSRTYACQCGAVTCEASGDPIVCAVCYCTDCQHAGNLFAQNPGAAKICDADGGTPFVTMLDRNWRVVTGEDHIKPFKLKPGSRTVRYVGACCDTPIYVKLEPGFWVSSYWHLYGNPPPLVWRNKTGRRTFDLPFPDDLPRYKGFPLRLFWRLAKARMGL